MRGKPPSAHPSFRDAHILADKFAARLGLCSANPANRIPLQGSVTVDSALANVTITGEWAKQRGFSVPHLAFGRQLLPSKGNLTSPRRVERPAKRC